MDFTLEDVWAMELMRRYQSHNLKANLEEYHFWVDTLIFLHEAVSEEKAGIRYWQKLSEVLFYKFCFHGLTIHKILSGLEIRSIYYPDQMNGNTMIDIGSSKAILRSQLEAFLMYHHIYVNPESDNLKELRYNAWIYSSILQRQQFPAYTEYGKQQKEKDRKELEKMEGIIRNLESFKALSPKQQKALLEKGSGKLFNHWATIMQETGFSEKSPFSVLYALTSMYSHSEGLSAVQLENQPGDEQNTVRQADLDLHHSKLLVCLMIQTLVAMYPASKRKYDMLADQTRFNAEFYARMARSQTP